MTKWVARGILGLFCFVVYLMVSSDLYRASGSCVGAFLIYPIAFLALVCLLTWSIIRSLVD